MEGRYPVKKLAVLTLLPYLLFTGYVAWTTVTAGQEASFNFSSFGVIGSAIFFITAAALVLILTTKLEFAMPAQVLPVAQNSEMFDAMMASAVYAVIHLTTERDSSGRVIDFTVSAANGKACALLGIDLAAVHGKALRETPLHQPSFDLHAKCQAVVESGDPLEHDVKMVCAGGQAHWIREQIFAAQGGIALVCKDISDRKHIELENRNSRTLLETLIDYLPAAVYAHSMRKTDLGKMVVWNKTAEIVTGFPVSDVMGKKFTEVFPKDIADHYRDASQRMANDPMVVDRAEQPLRRPDGELRYLREISVPVFNEENEVEYVLGISEDITSRRKQELDLRTKQAELVATNDASPLGLFRINPGGQCIYVNRTCEEMSGLVGLDTIGRGWIELVHPDDRWMLLRAWRRTYRTRETFQGIYRFIRPDDRMIWTSLKIAPIIVDHEIKGYAGSIDDITNRRNAELALRQRELHLRTIADTVPAQVAYVGADERFHFTNLAFERAFDVPREMLNGMTMRELFGDSLYGRIRPYIAQALAGDKTLFEVDEQRNGAYRCVETIYTPQFDHEGNGHIVGLHIMSTDITSKKLHERRLLQMTKVDSLTGLLNRSGFEQKLHEAMRVSRAHGVLMAIMYLDIDRFKLINDTYGHPIGDLLLKSFVGRLLRVLRSTDAVSRLGGDEFTIIMENFSRPEDAEQIAAKIRHAMQLPFIIEDLTLDVTTSIGLAYYRGGDISSEILIRQADEMLYAAKQAGRNTYRIATLQEAP